MCVLVYISMDRLTVQFCSGNGEDLPLETFEGEAKDQASPQYTEIATGNLNIFLDLCAFQQCHSPEGISTSAATMTTVLQKG